MKNLLMACLTVLTLQACTHVNELDVSVNRQAEAVRSHCLSVWKSADFDLIRDKTGLFAKRPQTILLSPEQFVAEIERPLIRKLAELLEECEMEYVMSEYAVNAPRGIATYMQTLATIDLLDRLSRKRISWREFAVQRERMLHESALIQSAWNKPVNLP